MIFILLFAAGCASGETSSTDSAGPPSETITTLFEKAAGTLRDYTAEEPLYVLYRDFNGKAFEMIDGVIDFSNLHKTIDNCSYLKTLLKYQQAVDKYSEIFTGEALDSFLSKYFYDIDGDLYVNCAGGMSGFDIENITITYINQNDGEYFYQVTYDHVIPYEDANFELQYEVYPSECHFTVRNIDGNYRISSIDYLSNFFTDYPYASK